MMVVFTSGNRYWLDCSQVYRGRVPIQDDKGHLEGQHTPHSGNQWVLHKGRAVPFWAGQLLGHRKRVSRRLCEGRLPTASGPPRSKQREWQKKSGAHTAVTSGVVNLDSYVPMTATTLTDCDPYHQLGRYDIRNVHPIPIAMAPLELQCQDSDEKALDQQGY